MSNESLPLHMHWRKAYDANPFLRHLSEEQLQQRVRDVVLNMLLLTEDGKIGLGSPEDADAMGWMLRWTQVLQEMQRRHGPPPNGFTNGFMREEALPDFAGELASKAAAVFRKRDLAPGRALIKYGKAEHMGALLARGQARIQAASYFAAIDHNGAIRDDELNLGISLVLSRKEMLGLVVNPQDVPKNAGDQIFSVNYKSQSDYWLYCVTRSLNPRLFVDFGAEACVIIRNDAAFAERLNQAVIRRLPTKSSSLAGMAMYVDPHQPETAKIAVPLAKHFRYSYQKEYRFAWLPDTPTEKLEHVDVEIGPLDDIAELVVL